MNFEKDKVIQLSELVALLKSDDQISWEQIEELVQGFSGFQEFVYLLQNPPVPARPAFPAPSREGAYISDALRQKLLGIFLPYSILLNKDYSPHKRITLLEREAGVNVQSFCEQCLHNRSPEIAEAAQVLLSTSQIEFGLAVPVRPTTLGKSYFHRCLGWLTKLFKS